jgi:hypothetical protein
MISKKHRNKTRKLRARRVGGNPNASRRSNNAKKASLIRKAEEYAEKYANTEVAKIANNNEVNIKKEHHNHIKNYMVLFNIILNNNIESGRDIEDGLDNFFNTPGKMLNAELEANAEWLASMNSPRPPKSPRTAALNAQAFAELNRLNTLNKAKSKPPVTANS